MWPWMLQSVQLSHILLSQRGAVGGGRCGLGCSKVCNCHTFCSPRGVLLEVVDVALDAPKSATVTHFALPEGCCWRWSMWPWMLQSVQLSHILLSQRGAVGGGRCGLGCSKVCNCHTFCSSRGVLLEVVDVALDAPKCATVTHFALPEGCCWRWLMWPWIFQCVQLSHILLSQRVLLE